MMNVFLAGPVIQILSFKNDFLKVAIFGETCSNMHVLGMYEGKFRIFIGNCIGECEVISLFLALCRFWKKFVSGFLDVTHFSGHLAVSC